MHDELLVPLDDQQQIVFNVPTQQIFNPNRFHHRHRTEKYNLNTINVAFVKPHSNNNKQRLVEGLSLRSLS